MPISENCSAKIIHLYKEKLSHEMNRSLSLEQEKMHWENEFRLLSKKNKGVSIFINQQHTVYNYF